MPARVDLLDREQRKRDEMFQMQLRQQNQALQGSPVDPAATMRPRQQLYQPQETPTQLESQYRRRGPSTAAQAILSGRSPTAGTALLKTIAAGFAGHQQRKGEKARETKLAKAIERQEQIVSAAESKVIEKNMGDMVPPGMSGQMGHAQISDVDAAAMADQGGALARQAEIERVEAEQTAELDREKAGLDRANIISQMEDRGVSTKEEEFRASTSLVPGTPEYEEQFGGYLEDQKTNYGDKTKIKLSARQQGQVDNLNAGVAEIESVITNIKNFNEGKGSDFNESSIANLLLGSGMSYAPVLTNNIMGIFGDVDENLLRSDVQRLSADEFHEKYAGALSASEAARGERWGVGSVGIGAPETLGRLEALLRTFKRKKKAIEYGMGEDDGGVGSMSDEDLFN